MKLHLFPIFIGLFLGRHVAAQNPCYPLDLQNPCYPLGPPVFSLAPQISGTCQGSGAAVCSMLFDAVCDPCDLFDCFNKLPACNAACIYPGCSNGCKIIEGECRPGLVTPSHVRCEGKKPLPCADITSQSSCLLAENCAWIPGPPQIEAGYCEGTAITNCKTLYTAETCNPDIKLELYDCLNYCTHPGCECKSDTTAVDWECGILPYSYGPLTKIWCENEPGPMECFMLNTKKLCDNAQGCAWIEGSEFCFAVIPGSDCSGYTTATSCLEDPGCSWQGSTLAETCGLEIEITCKAEDGQDCEDIKPPTDTRCAKGNPPFTLYFTYKAEGCGQHTNRQGKASTCKDLGVLSKSGSVGIVCVDAENVQVKMVVLPDVVAPGDDFTVSLERIGTFPAKTACSIVSTSSTEVFQKVTMDTSGKFDLDIKDRFGALQLEGCDDIRCVREWTYGTELVNTRENDFTIDKYDLVLDVGETIDLLPFIESKIVVGKGGLKSIPVPVDVDVCTEGELGATAQIVLTDNASREQCGGSSDPLRISNDVDCKLDLSIECTGSKNNAADLSGVDCTVFVGEQRGQCLCGSCARELRFRYTASDCSATTAQQGFVCSDLGPLPTEARVVVKQGETNIFEAKSVKVGEDIIVSNGGLCLPDALTVYVMPTRTSNPAQVFDLTTSCASNPNKGIMLLNPYGAFNFVGFSCNENSIHNCFVEVEHKVCVDNGGTNPRSLATVDLEVNGPPVIDLVQGIPVNDRILRPGESRCFTHMDEVELCKTQVYELAASAGTSDDCPDGNYVPKVYIFTILWPGPQPSLPVQEIQPEVPYPPPVIPYPPPAIPADCPTGPISVFAPPKPAHCP